MSLSVMKPLSASRGAQASRARNVRVQAASWTKALTMDELKAAGGKKVVEMGGQKVLIVDNAGSLYAVSNK